MKEPTKAEKREFWEWCGFIPQFQGGAFVGWRYPNRPDPITEGAVYCAPNPDIDLNNLFKYAVPKVITEKGLYIVRTTILASIFHALKEDEDPALALFWALDEVRKNETG